MLVRALLLFLIFSVSMALPAASAPAAKRVIVIDKAKKNLVLFINGKRAAQFPAAFGMDPDSDKYKAFDCATPEGLYFISHKKQSSRFHRFLGISYPNLADAEQGLAMGVISMGEYQRIYDAVQRSRPAPVDTGLGGGIGIHGGGVFRYFGNNRERDWTQGCIALNNKDIETLFQSCGVKDPVIIFNSRKNLYGLVRPFCRIMETSQGGAPPRGDGTRVYGIKLTTSMGKLTAAVKEGKKGGRSLEVAVYDAHDPEKPFLVLCDQNTDGRLSPLDGITGLAEYRDHPETTYQRLREAVAAALSTGNVTETVW